MGRWFLTYDFETSDVWLEDIFDDFQTLCMRWSWWWSSSKGPRDFVKRKRDGSPVTNSMQRTEVCNCSVNLHHHWKAVLISIHFCESVNSRFDMEMQLSTQCLKITQNVAFEFSNFGIFNQFFVWYDCLIASLKCKRSSLRSQFWMRLFHLKCTTVIC